MPDTDAALHAGSRPTAPGSSSARKQATPERSAWSAALGAHWRVLLGALAVLLFLLGASAPLADPDLPMHLALGEWMVRHRAFPVVEPFAWTRPDAPYYAYSWAMDVAYYLLQRRGGPVALHALQGVLVAAAGAAVLYLGWAARWRPWPTLLLVLLHVAVSLIVVPHLRPQFVLAIVVPAAWGAAHQLARGDRALVPMLVLAGAGALAVNVHFLFALTAAPLLWLMARAPAARRSWLAALALAGGWLLTPYALLLPDVFRLNLTTNVLFGPQSPIREYQPGFVALTFPGMRPVAALALLLASLPWVVSPTRGARERFVFFVLWLGGLALFGLAARGLLLWWLAALPLAYDLCGRMPDPVSPGARRSTVAALLAGVALLALRALADAAPLRSAEGDADSRTLPTEGGLAADPLARWLDCHTRPGAAGRIYTSFNHGSYLAWRLPTYSASIDGRTIFPDSVAEVEASQTPKRAPVRLGPWRSADVAMLTTWHPVSGVLDTAPGWRRVAFTVRPRTPPAGDTLALWVNERWWGGVGTAPLAGAAERLRYGAAPGVCSALREATE